MSKHLATAERWFQEVWSNENQEAIFEMFVPEGKADGLGNPIIGPKEFAVFHEALLKLVSDVEVKVDHYIEQGDRIALSCTFYARKRSNPEVRVQMKGHTMVRMGEGVLIDAENSWDFLGLFEQLGLFPENAFMSALQGESVGE